MIRKVINVTYIASTFELVERRAEIENRLEISKTDA